MVGFLRSCLCAVLVCLVILRVEVGVERDLYSIIIGTLLFEWGFFALGV